MSKVYARAAGWVALLLGIIGLFVHDLLGLIQFDAMHTIIHLVLGILGIAAARHVKWANYYAYVLGTCYLIVGIVGFFFPVLAGLHLEVTENLLHILLGAWGLYAALGEKSPPQPHE